MIALNTFQGDEKSIVVRVARLIKMCGNRRRADEFVVILYGAAMFPKAFVELACRTGARRETGYYTT